MPRQKGQQVVAFTTSPRGTPDRSEEEVGGGSIRPLGALLGSASLHSPLSAMKLIPASAAALALIASSFGLALPATAFETKSKDPLAIRHADIMVGGYLDSLESLMGTDPRKVTSLVQDLRAQCRRVALPASLKADLVASSEHLLQRMSEARLERADLDLLRLEVVNARISYGLESIAATAAANEWDEKKLHAAVMGWLGSTTIFKDAPDPRGYRAKLAAKVEFGMLQSTGTVAASRSLTVQMLRLRLAIALRRYELAYDRGNLTEAEFDRLQRMAIVRVRRIIKSDF